MTDKLKQIIKEETEKLPKENQKIINTFDWVDIIDSIGKKYEISEDQINDLQIETLLVLIGLEEMTSYSSNLEYEVCISKEKLEKIVNEVLEKIFTPIANKISEKIKEEIKTKNPNWEQNVSFILSGGDYSVFVATPPPLSGEDRGEVINSPHPNPLPKGEGGSIPTQPPKKITDIKSRFTI